MSCPFPSIEEQRRIAAILDQADAMRTRRRESIAMVESLTESIFHDTFRRSSGGSARVPVASLAASTPHSIRTGPFGSQLLRSEFVDEGIAVLGIDNAVNDRFEWGRPRFITPGKFEQLRKYEVRPGDVLVTIMATCGRVAIVPDDIPTAINTKHLCCISLDQELCCSTYLWACFRFDQELRRQLGTTARGAVMPGLNMGLIKGALVEVPPLEQQREFDRLVEVAQTLQNATESAGGELDKLFASMQHRAFSGQL